ncbi:MAG: DUF3267 domain-containing protein, partial [Thermomicrobiales bacterium]|nr:DUF3267 domain-containing protein [Thermomicrobiales bacterium]
MKRDEARAGIRPWIGDPPRTEAPELPGYVQLHREQLGMGALTIIGFVLIPLWWFIFVALVSLAGGPSSSSFEINLTTLFVGALIALVLVPVLHEAVHGIAGMLVGATPSYGIGPGFAYTTFPEPLRKWQYLTVGIAPLIVLSILSVLVAARWESVANAAIFFAVINAAGAIGDLWMSWKILRTPS